jgi:hypothetical protein
LSGGPESQVARPVALATGACIAAIAAAINAAADNLHDMALILEWRGDDFIADAHGLV